MICLVDLWLLLPVELLGEADRHPHMQESIFLSYYKSNPTTTWAAFSNCH